MENIELLLTHWPFISVSIVGMFLNQFLKKGLFTFSRANSSEELTGFFWWGYKTLPLQPVLLGLIIGVFWLNPLHKNPAWPLIASMFYFATAGGMSVFLYEMLKSVLKRRGIDINMPGSKKL